MGETKLGCEIEAGCENSQPANFFFLFFLKINKKNIFFYFLCERQIIIFYE